MPKRYYRKSDMTGKYIMIEHGKEGYYDTNIETDSEADMMNHIQGNTKAEIEAAHSCSLFNCWDNFNKLKEKLK